MRQTVLITNFILRETPIEGGEPKARRSAWEAYFGETPHLDTYATVLWPFGCLAFLILTKEQRQARGLCGHFGNRTLEGLYLAAAIMYIRLCLNDKDSSGGEEVHAVSFFDNPPPPSI